MPHDVFGQVWSSAAVSRSFYLASACTACRARYCFTNSVRLSVRPSVCLSVMLCIVSKRMRYLQTFPLSGSGFTLVFNPIADTKFQEEPPRWGGGLNSRAWEKLRFSNEIAVYLGNGTIQAHGYYWSLIESHRQPIDPCRFQWSWVTLKGGTRATHFYAYALTAWPRTTKFGTVTHVRKGRVYMVHPRPHPRGRGLSVPQTFRTSYVFAHGIRNINQILRGQTRRQKKSTGSTMPPCRDQKFLWHECWRAICLR